MYKKQLQLAQGKNDIVLDDWFELINEDVLVWVNAFKHRGQGWGEVVGNTLTIDVSKAGVYNILLMGTRCDHCAKTNWTGVEVPPEESEENTNGSSGA